MIFLVFIITIFYFAFLFFYFFSLIPFPFYCGSSLWRFSMQSFSVQFNLRCLFDWMIGVDNGNIGFLLLIAILFPFIYWIAGIESNLMNFTLLFLFLFFLLVISFLLVSLLLFFVFYECLIILHFSWSSCIR